MEDIYCKYCKHSTPHYYILTSLNDKIIKVIKCEKQKDCYYPFDNKCSCIYYEDKYK